MISHGWIESMLIYILNKYVAVYIGIYMLLIANFIKRPLLEIDNSYVYLFSIIPLIFYLLSTFFIILFKVVFPRYVLQVYFK